MGGPRCNFTRNARSCQNLSQHQFCPSPARERHREMLRTLTYHDFSIFQVWTQSICIWQTTVLWDLQNLGACRALQFAYEHVKDVGSQQARILPLTSKPWVQGWCPLFSLSKGIQTEIHIRLTLQRSFACKLHLPQAPVRAQNSTGAGN